MKTEIKRVLAVLPIALAFAMQGTEFLSVAAPANAQVTDVKTTVTVQPLSSAAGWLHVCEVRSNSTLACKGDNSSGQLGNGTLEFSSDWIRVNSGFLRGKSVIAVGAGDYTSCAITKDRQLACWGENASSQLGDGTTTNRSVPTLINGGYLEGKRVQSVDGKTNHTCAVTVGGKLACWGGNYNGQLGDGTTTNRSLPKLINTGFLAGKEVTAVSTGWIHSCALTSAGQVACWGSNFAGQLGDGTRGDGSMTPQLVNGGFLAGKRVVAISVGRDHTCALTSAGQVACWGSNSGGELGDGTFQDRLLPRLINGGFLAGKKVNAISAGWVHTCAVTTNSQVACWGDNSAGQLGDGSLVNRNSPVRSPAHREAVTAVSAGFTFTQIITESNDLIYGTFEYDFCTGSPILSSKGELHKAC